MQVWAVPETIMKELTELIDSDAEVYCDYPTFAKKSFNYARRHGVDY